MTKYAKGKYPRTKEQIDKWRKSHAWWRPNEEQIEKIRQANLGRKRPDLAERQRTHGLTKTRFYRIWGNMNSRCNRPNVPCYNRYGGRGIKLLDNWEKFDNFKNDMYESYLSHVTEFGEKNTSIDRVNNAGHYEKKNCRWATNIEQTRNARSNRIITIGGETKLLTDWAKHFNRSLPTFHYRINQGWSEEKALITPPNRKNI